MRWLLYLAGVGCLVVAMEWGGSIGAFIDPQSLIIVLAPTFLFASAFHSPLTIWNAPKHALRTDPVSAETLNASIAALISARSLSHASGGIGFLIVLVQMLQALDDPSKIGPAVAVCILSPFYALFLAEVLIAPLLHRLRQRATSQATHPAV